MTRSTDDVLSRREVEALCLLHVIGEGCPAPELAARLGLSDGLDIAVRSAAQVQVTEGNLELEDEVYRRSAKGRAYLDQRLAGLEASLDPP